MGTPIIKGKDALAAIKTMRSGGRSSSTIMTRAEKLAIKNSGALGKRAVMNPNASLTPAQLRKVLNEVRGASAQVDESHRQFATYKDTGAITRKELKILSEEQKKVEGGKGAQGEGKSDWEQRLEEKKEEAERKVLKIKREGEALGLKREGRIHNIASQRSREDMRKAQEEEKRADLKKIADEEPAKLASEAIDLQI